LFYRIIGGWLEYYSDSKGEWKISEGVLEDVVELPLAEPAINWNEAPEWATCVARADWSNQLAWCCSTQYQYIGLFNPYQIINTHIFTLIEMRPEPAAWMPEVGQECEAVWIELPDGGGNDFCAVVIKGYYDDEVWLSKVNGVGYSEVVKIADCKFRPLKTAAEKKRDAFMSQAKAGLSFDMKYNHVVDSVLEQLADNGFKAPEGDQS
ncbi:MAG: hypothetical protein GY881_15820, partial [Gammaproteobacteria bacterium]|nr:hypothetical protein [Gammaproteobacteria bacterium]